MSSDYWTKLNETVNGAFSSVQKSVSSVSSTFLDAKDAIPVLEKWIPKKDVKSTTPVPITSVRSTKTLMQYLSDNRRALFFGSLAVIGSIGGVYYYNKSLKFKLARVRSMRRMAERGDQGERKEVVLIIGSLKEPVVRFTAIDLSRRGYTVYITTTPEDNALFNSVEVNYVRPLLCSSFTDPHAISACINDLKYILKSGMRSGDPKTPSLKLSSIIVCPDLFNPVGPIEALPPLSIAASIQNKLVVAMNLFTNELLDLARVYKTKIVFVMPSNIANLNPAFHAVESSSHAALQAFSLTLERELRPHGVKVIHINFGSFDCSTIKLKLVRRSKQGSHSHGKTNDEGTTEKSDAGNVDMEGEANPGNSTKLARVNQDGEKQVQNNARADVLVWSQPLRNLYGNSYLNSSSLVADQIRGPALISLSRAIADVLHPFLYTPRVVYVGRGARLYAWMHRYLPERVMTYLLGLRTLNYNFTFTDLFRGLFI